MISSTCNFREFMETVGDQSRADLIHTVVTEATEAERLFYRMKKTPERPERDEARQYASMLKDLVTFLRYGVCTSMLRRADLSSLANPR